MSTSIAIEGGLLDPDFLERLATDPEKEEGQKPEAFGFQRKLRLADEIQDVFGRVLSHWRTFERRREAVGESGRTGVTREAWLLPVLRELGWNPGYRREAFRMGATTFAVSHAEPVADGEPAVPIHLAPFDQELDERGRERLSPHALVQELLNRSDFLWGIVTNGRRLRILRQSARTTRQSFLEIDLEAIATAELYPDFALLFRLFHRSRFPTAPADHACWLERWHQQAIEEGGRVKERLRLGVETALRRLGEGFLRHPDSTALREKLARGQLAAEAYWRELLALVYRLLFLMTAEERRLLARPEDPADRYRIYERWYGLGRLRDLAESRHGRDSFADLWIGLSVLFRALEEPEEAAKLGLSALDGDLFAAAACGDLEEARIANTDLLDAILELSTFVPLEGTGRRKKAGARRRVRYAALDVEELGSVYESLLDLHPAIDLEKRCFDLLAGSERKSTGSYYTPIRSSKSCSRAPSSPSSRRGFRARRRRKRRKPPSSPCASSTRPWARAISCWGPRGGSPASSRSCARARRSPPPRSAERRSATSSATASTRSTRTPWRSTSPKWRSGSRARRRMPRSPSSTTASAAAIRSSASSTLKPSPAASPTRPTNHSRATTRRSRGRSPRRTGPSAARARSSASGATSSVRG